MLKSMGKRITARRHELQCTQEDLAQALSVTQQHISGIESGKLAPSLPLLGRLAQQLGVTMDYLVTGKEGGIVDTISVIKADKKLSVKSKKALVSLIEELYRGSATDTE